MSSTFVPHSDSGISSANSEKKIPQCNQCCRHVFHSLSAAVCRLNTSQLKLMAVAMDKD